MKKLILLSLFLASTIASAQSDKDVVKQLESLQSDIKLEVRCETCEAQKVSLPTPQQVIKDINAGKLTYLGRDLFPGSDQNKTCVYKSETAYILYNNCMASKKEALATDIEVIPFTGGVVRFYIENNKTVGPISTIKRDGYDMNWTISSEPSAPLPSNLDVAKLKTFKKEVYDSLGGSCYIGSTFKAQDMNMKGACFGKMKDKGADWIPQTESFWKEPGKDWYDSLKYLRKTVVGTKF